MWSKVLLEELKGARERLALALHLAWSDTRTRYRRSVLGPFWLVLGTLIGVGGLAFVWGALFEVERATFVPMLSIGLVVWYFLSGTIVEASSVYYSQRELMLNIPVSSILVSIVLLARNMVTLAHNFIVVIAVLILFPDNLSVKALYAVPGLVLVCLNLLWIIQLVGYIGARYRDLSPLLAAIMQPLFFLTPVLFRTEQLGASSFIVSLNPLTHFLSVVRDPLMGSVPPPSTWAVVLALCVAGWLAALTMTALKRRRLAYWVN